MDEVDEGNKLPTFFLIINQKQIIMIDVKECIKFCIENFTPEEATERLYKFMNESLELKEKEIELKYSINKLINFKEEEKEITIDYLKSNIESIFGCEYDPCEGKWIIYIDPLNLTKWERKQIDSFWKKNKSTYLFVFQNKNYPCKGY